IAHGRAGGAGAQASRRQPSTDGGEVIHAAPLLRPRSPSDIARRHGTAVSAEVLAATAPIVEDVRRRGEAALREHARRFDEIEPGEPLVIERPALHRALGTLDPADRERLERVAGRIRAFAEAQRRSFVDVTVPVPGGVAGHRAEDRTAQVWTPVAIGSRLPPPA